MKKPAPFGKYFLLERINVGGMAEVFRAKAFGVEGFERLVAVKRILSNIAEDKEFIRMFIEEAKLSVQLNHANIAQIFDLGVVDGSYYIALEHVHGRDLRGIFDRCRQLGEAMPVAQACFVVMKLCEGLDYAHNKRDQSGRELSLVHRDVSPQNLLVSFEGEVKIIDFGIAKAAGKGSKTQAGILKGKFGYMSPEQVRGLPVDRRSDVFSCGIVLYELLTGERLFVGESDFSTLEKVRNVEILPPSTYNRKIPDELERIVLKALSKDADERYQNAIDLHDELQAFVYTAGEFYSRKDLAGWMKKTFGKEIEEETAKLESYRQLKPPAVDQPARAPSGSKPPPTTPVPGAGSGPPPVRRATQGMPVVASGTKPPPPPSRTSQQLATVAPPAPAPASKPRERRDESGDLIWDDDELETQIYDNPDDDPRNKQPGAARTTKSLPVEPAASQLAAAEHESSTNPLPVATGPDLSSLVSSTAKAWESGEHGLGGLGGNGSNGSAPMKFATGSQKSVAQEPTALRDEASGIPIVFDPIVPTVTHMPPAFVGLAGLPAPAGLAGPSAASPGFAPDFPAGLSGSADEPFDPMAVFGQGIVSRKRSNKRAIIMIAVGGAAVAVLAVAVIIMVTGTSDKVAEAPEPTPAISVIPTPPVEPADQNTGFDLYVSPAGITQWKLDGDARTDRLPSRIRGIQAGQHTVQIDPPAGFLGQTQPVIVEAGKAGKVEITLHPIEGLKGRFESNPPGATVSLIIDGARQALGPSPQDAPLDPRKTYQVLFEKAGYVSVNRPLAFTGVVEEKLVVNLEKAGSLASSDQVGRPDRVRIRMSSGGAGSPTVTPGAPRDAKTGQEPPGAPRDPRSTQEPSTAPGSARDSKAGQDPAPGTSKVGQDTKPGTDGSVATDTKAPKGDGILTLGSKPPCEIYIDGAATGMHTPQREIKLAAGRHRITLVNNEYSIKESFAVDVKADAPAKMIKDYTDRLPK